MELRAGLSPAGALQPPPVILGRLECRSPSLRSPWPWRRARRRRLSQALVISGKYLPSGSGGFGSWDLRWPMWKILGSLIRRIRETEPKASETEGLHLLLSSSRSLSFFPHWPIPIAESRPEALIQRPRNSSRRRQAAASRTRRRRPRRPWLTRFKPPVKTATCSFGPKVVVFVLPCSRENISLNGLASRTAWQYIAANSSFCIRPRSDSFEELRSGDRQLAFRLPVQLVEHCNFLP